MTEDESCACRTVDEIVHGMTLRVLKPCPLHAAEYEREHENVKRALAQMLHERGEL